MEKEEILEASKKENKNKDVYEIQVESKGATYAGLSMLILALIFYTYEIFSGKGSNPAFYSIITIYNAVLFGYKAIKLEKGGFVKEAKWVGDNTYKVTGRAVKGVKNG